METEIPVRSDTIPGIIESWMSKFRDPLPPRLTDDQLKSFAVWKRPVYLVCRLTYPTDFNERLKGMKDKLKKATISESNEDAEDDADFLFERAAYGFFAIPEQAIDYAHYMTEHGQNYVPRFASCIVVYCDTEIQDVDDVNIYEKEGIYFVGLKNPIYAYKNSD